MHNTKENLVRNEKKHRKERNNRNQSKEGQPRKRGKKTIVEWKKNEKSMGKGRKREGRQKRSEKKGKEDKRRTGERKSRVKWKIQTNLETVDDNQWISKFSIFIITTSFHVNSIFIHCILLFLIYHIPQQYHIIHQEL